MMCSKILWSQCKGDPVKRDRVHASHLPVRYRRTFIRQTTLNPQPGVVWVDLQRFVNGLPVRDIFVRVSAAFQIIQFAVANRDPRLFALAELRRQRCRSLKGSARRCRVLQTDIGIRQPEEGHAEIGI